MVGKHSEAKVKNLGISYLQDTDPRCFS